MSTINTVLSLFSTFTKQNPIDSTKDDGGYIVQVREEEAVQKLHHVNRAERITRTAADIIYAGAKGLCLTSLVTGASFEIQALVAGSTTTCLLNNGGATLPIISLITGLTGLALYGTKDILSSGADYCAVKRETSKHEAMLKTTSTVPWSLSSLFISGNMQKMIDLHYQPDVKNKLNEVVSEDNNENIINTQNNEVVNSNVKSTKTNDTVLSAMKTHSAIQNIKLKPPSYCERITDATSKIFSSIGKVSGVLASFGLVGLQLYSTRLKNCGYTSAINPILTTCISLGGVGLGAYLVGSLFSSVVRCQKTIRVNEAVTLRDKN